MNQKLPLEFYLREDVLQISRELLGKQLFTHFDGELTGGIIVETEAYRAPGDRASHAHLLKRTKRNVAMYDQGGVCYVYLCYGIHALLNVVTNQENLPHAVLIRAIQPTTGIDTMLKRRQKSVLNRSITGGPGALTQALGITTFHNRVPLTGTQIWIEENNMRLNEEEIIASPRVGIDYAGEDAALPWRFRIKKSAWTSPAK